MKLTEIWRNYNRNDKIYSHTPLPPTHLFIKRWVYLAWAIFLEIEISPNFLLITLGFSWNIWKSSNICLRFHKATIGWCWEAAASLKWNINFLIYHSCNSSLLSYTGPAYRAWLASLGVCLWPMSYIYATENVIHRPAWSIWNKC